MKAFKLLIIKRKGDNMKIAVRGGHNSKAIGAVGLLNEYVEDRKGHDRRYAIAPDKIKAEIGWYPETMFKDGIKLTIKWYLENEEWMNNVTSGDYQKYYSEMYK